MFEHKTIDHFIQKHILKVLMFNETARFRDLRPPKVDTNLFSYHLTLLVRNKFVKKVDGGYQLDSLGLNYVDRVSLDKNAIRVQPKIITMLLIQNSEGEVLLQRRAKQPYANTWTLPYGKVHIDDASLLSSARREADEKLHYQPADLTHAGDCYIRVFDDKEIISATLAHIFKFESDDIQLNDQIMWLRPEDLNNYKLSPAVEQIIARSFFNDPYFFEEFSESLTV